MTDVELYATRSYFFRETIDMPSGTRGTNLNWTFKYDTSTINGTGVSAKRQAETSSAVRLQIAVNVPNP